MPKRYESMRDRFIRQGMKAKNAKTKAAKIENSLRGEEGKPPMQSHKGKRRRLGKLNKPKQK